MVTIRRTKLSCYLEYQSLLHKKRVFLKDISNHGRPEKRALPSRSMTAPTLELRSSFMSPRQSHSTANTRLKHVGNCRTRCVATGMRQEAATERTSSSRSPSLCTCRVNEKSTPQQRKSTCPSTAASTTSCKICWGPRSRG
jgi:hypothetical protein